MLCEHGTGLQFSSKLKYGNIKVLGVKHNLKNKTIMENVDFKQAFKLLASMLDRSMSPNFDEIGKNDYKVLAYRYKQAVESFYLYPEDSLSRKFDIEAFEDKLSSFEHRISVKYIYKPWEQSSL